MTDLSPLSAREEASSLDKSFDHRRCDDFQRERAPSLDDSSSFSLRDVGMMYGTSSSPYNQNRASSFDDSYKIRGVNLERSPSRRDDTDETLRDSEVYTSGGEESFQDEYDLESERGDPPPEAVPRIPSTIVTGRAHLYKKLDTSYPVSRKQFLILLVVVAVVFLSAACMVLIDRSDEDTASDRNSEDDPLDAGRPEPTPAPTGLPTLVSPAPSPVTKEDPLDDGSKPDGESEPTFTPMASPTGMPTSISPAPSLVADRESTLVPKRPLPGMPVSFPQTLAPSTQEADRAEETPHLPTALPTKAVTETQRPSPATGYSDLMDQLATVSNPASLFMDSSSPQARAADWLIHLDQMSLTADSPNLFQRYALAVLHFSTGGGIVNRTGWKHCSGNPDPTDIYSEEVLRCIFQDGQTPFCAHPNDFIECTYEGETFKRFLSPVHECEWFGLVCDERERVMEVNLEQNDLRGALPPEIGKLTGLQQLRLEHNELQGSIPEELYSLSKLNMLTVDHNSLTGSLSSLIGNLKELTSLSLHFNQFTGELCTELGLLTELYALQIHRNSFSGEVPLQVCDLDLDRFKSDCLPNRDDSIQLDCPCCTDCCSQDPDDCLKM